MNNKNKTIKIVLILIIILTLVGATFAFWIFNSDINKDIIFNTNKKLEEYIIYDSGESKYVGNFNLGSNYLEGVHTNISIYKTKEASNTLLYASINMTINEIGNNMKMLPGLKWLVTLDNDTYNKTILASGDFLNISDLEEFTLLSNIEVTQEKKEYTIWIWLDENEQTSNQLLGETIDISLWTKVDQITK